MNRLTFVVLSSTLLAACGGAAPAALAPSNEEPEPASLDEAKAQLARAKASLGGGAGAGSDRQIAPAEPAPSPPQSGASAEDTQVKRTLPAPQKNAADEKPEASCPTACSAIRSMRRAVAAICRMAGDTDAACVDARHTLVTSEDRVARCGC
jgi:hypothetical protein